MNCKSIEEAARKCSLQVRQPYKSAPVGMSDYDYWVSIIEDVILSDAAKEYWLEQFKAQEQKEKSAGELIREDLTAMYSHAPKAQEQKPVDAEKTAFIQDIIKNSEQNNT